MPRRLRLLVTRPVEDAGPLVAVLNGLGMAATAEPLLDIVFHPGAALDLAGVQAILMTSANGVRAFAARTPERTLPVLAVGDASAGAARALGFTSVAGAAGEIASTGIGASAGSSGCAWAYPRGVSAKSRKSVTVSKKTSLCGVKPNIRYIFCIGVF